MVMVVAYIFQILFLLISIAGLLYLIHRKASSEQGLLTAAFICFFLCNFGAVLRFRAPDIGSVITASKFIYLGYTVPCLIFLSFVFRVTGKKVNTAFTVLICIFSVLAILSATVFYERGWFTVISDYANVNGFATFKCEFKHGAIVTAFVDAFVTFYAVSIFLRWFNETQNRDTREPEIRKIRYQFFIFVFCILYIIVLISEFFLPWQAAEPLPYYMGAVAFFILVMLFENSIVTRIYSPRDTLIESLPDAVIILDHDFMIVDMNRTTPELFSEIGGRIGSSLPDQYAFLLDDYDEVIGFTHEGRHFERRFVPILREGQIYGYGLVITDVSPAHKMMVEMRELKRSADIANEAKSSFLANMSHEIRTPMNAIVGYVELLSREKLSKEGRMYADEIRSSSNSLLHIINDILDFSKIEQGKLEIMEEEYEPEALFAEVGNITRMQSEKKGLKFVSLIDPDIPSVLYGDKVRIKQVLLNITGNAVKFTDVGTVKLAAEWHKTPDGRAELSITVTDTGIGIASENMNKLFNEFEQVDIRSTMTKPGTGLGLVISKSLLEMMGGSIDITSEYGVGTSVTITIRQRIISPEPAAKRAEKAERENHISSKTFAAPDAKILVVDDNKVNLELMNNYLKQYRIIPDTADGGAKAVSMAAKKQYDIIFMDQMMPEMDGVEAMKRIRALGSSYVEKMPIIALTANAIAGTRNLLISEGFTDYASKPMPIKVLENLLTKYLPKGTYTINAEEHGTGDVSDMKGVLKNDRAVLELPDYVDQSIGMTNAGEDIAQYREVIGIVYKYAHEKLDTVKELLKNEDYQRYTIEVHALKSNAATVGAMKLADKAKALEDAGKTGDIETIKRDTDGFLTEYAAFADDLKKCMDYEAEMSGEDAGDTDAKQTFMSAADEEYLSTFEEIENALGDARYEDTNDLLGVLEFFDLPPVVAHAVGAMREAAAAQDWAGVLDIVRKLR
ncbi:MAG: response regulator [Lachnospiraceae bacterium]|nr:response regulator [Lachnospiraceae bacterium]